MEQADLLVIEGRIAEKGRRIAPSDEVEVIDARGRILIPGLVDAHTRLTLDPVAGLTGKGLETLAGPERYRRLEESHTQESIICSAFAGAVEALRSGVTCVVDGHASPSFVRGSLTRLREVLSTVGLRAILGYRLSEIHGPEVTAATLAECEEAAAYGGNERVQMTVALGSTLDISDETLRAVAGVAAEFAVPVQVDLGAIPHEKQLSLERHGASSLQRLERAALLSPGTIAVHATGLDQEDLDLLRQREVTLVHTPQSDLVNRRELAPLSIFAGGALGTAEHQPDVLAAARAAHDRALGAGEEGIDPEKILELIRNGHRLASRVFGLSFGSFEAGAEADLVILNYRPAVPLNAETVARHMVHGIETRHVVSVMVAGHFVIRDGLVLDLDTRSLYRELQRGALDFWMSCTGGEFPGFATHRRDFEPSGEEAEEEPATASDEAANSEAAAAPPRRRRRRPERQEEVEEEAESSTDEGNLEDDDEEDAEAESGEGEPEEGNVKAGEEEEPPDVKAGEKEDDEDAAGEGEDEDEENDDYERRVAEVALAPEDEGDEPAPDEPFGAGVY